LKILITGCAGQLGRSLVAELGRHVVTAIAHDRLDIARLDDVRRAIGTLTPHLVINAAAYNDVDGAERDPLASYRINALGPRNLALATAAAGVAILHVSTDYVFDGNTDQPYHEYNRPQPLSTYGLSKLAGEVAVKEYNPHHYVVRTAWLYHEVGQNFLNTMLFQSRRPQLKIVDDQFGSPTYAPHLARAIAHLIETQAYGVYHMAGQGGTTRFEMTRTLFSILGLRTEIFPASHRAFPAAASRPNYSVLTTIQEPPLLLPRWQEGISAFARALSAEHQLTTAGPDLESKNLGGSV
jgi:dTDP-4-dehydrorhamnose reductase